jgi:hypothetical protein
LEELFVKDCLVGEGGGDECRKDGEEKPFRGHYLSDVNDVGFWRKLLIGKGPRFEAAVRAP